MLDEADAAAVLDVEVDVDVVVGLDVLFLADELQPATSALAASAAASSETDTTLVGTHEAVIRGLFDASESCGSSGTG